MRPVILFCCCLLLLSSGASGAPSGPLQVRNQFPLFLGAAPPYLESAELRDSLTLGLHHSSVYLLETTAAWSVRMDLELTEMDIRLKKRITARTEIGLDLPVIRPAAGFLDGPLEEWHDLLGVGDYGRGARPQNEFLYAIDRNGAPVIRGESARTGLGDLRLTLKQVLLEGTATVSVLAGIEAPTGDARTGYGNGSIDLLAAVLADLQWGDVYRGYLNAGYIVPGDLKGYQTVGLRNAAYAALGLEAAWRPRFSLLVQTLAQQSPLPVTGAHHIDRPSVLLTVGGRYAFEQGSLELSLTEDASVSGAPDFIAQAAWTMQY